MLNSSKILGTLFMEIFHNLIKSKGVAVVPVPAVKGTKKK